MANEYIAPSTEEHYLADPQNQQKMGATGDPGLGR